ncbi:Flp pilus assembly protein CpaB [Actinomadura rudentiformis]|uniref:Flp pilus assembly protein CpaB n=1 Tax=Actinomadura rudentiformis TaxID=359158 RepID=A0A6H9YEC3_9ACTN|nr:Flp pilus assembly protein CpaB [Actinomadura rudentiformis]KAB2344121.1 Flp pilus assembly protein CpaB [Actinomadura rudentiformis]
MTGWLARWRRPLAALSAAAATGLALLALRPGPPPSVTVVAATRDLPGGSALRPGDLHTIALPAGLVPEGALRGPATGRLLAGPVRRGEPLTDARLMSPGLLRGQPPGTVATPIRIADAAAVRLLRTGDRIDVLATPSEATGPLSENAGPPWARLIVTGVTVLALPPPETPDQGAVVVVATSSRQASALVAASTRSRLSLTIVG